MNYLDLVSYGSESMKRYVVDVSSGEGRRVLDVTLTERGQITYLVGLDVAGSYGLFINYSNRYNSKI